jgi:hypothetical protein
MSQPGAAVRNTGVFSRAATSKQITGLKALRVEALEGSKTMRSGIYVAMAATLLFAAAPGCLPLAAQQLGQGRTTVTVLPHNKEAGPANISSRDFAVHVDGRLAQVTNWTQSAQSPLELVLLIDGSARASLGIHLQEIAQFVRALPPNTRVGIAYMMLGKAMFVAPLSTNRAQVLKELRLPIGVPGVESSPYFCLSSLAKHWPSQDTSARREVVMITDGVDRYELQYNGSDPYLQAAIANATRAHLIVYTIFWSSEGWINTTGYEKNAGQNLLLQLTSTTGGESYWFGPGVPVTFTPYFDDMLRRFQNQYELGVSAPLGQKPEMEAMKLKLSAPGSKVIAPKKIYIAPEQP